MTKEYTVGQIMEAAKKGTLNPKLIDSMSEQDKQYLDDTLREIKLNEEKINVIEDQLIKLQTLEKQKYYGRVTRQ